MFFLTASLMFVGKYLNIRIYSNIRLNTGTNDIHNILLVSFQYFFLGHRRKIHLLPKSFHIFYMRIVDDTCSATTRASKGVNRGAEAGFGLSYLLFICFICFCIQSSFCLLETSAPLFTPLRASVI